MDILIISPTPTHPGNQGNRVRIHNLCQSLRKRAARIHFLYFPREWGGRFIEKEYVSMRDAWDFFDVVPPSKDFVYIAEGEYFGLDDWWDSNIYNYIKWKTNGFRFDAVIVNYIFFSKALEYFPRSTVKIIDTHDRMSGRKELLEQNSVKPEFFYTSEADEARALKRADLVIAITESERRFFKSIAKTPVVTLGHICTTETIERKGESDIASIGFFGSANSINTKNLRDFFSFLKSERPDGIPGVEVAVFGGCCDVLRGEDLPRGVRLAGRVDTPEEFYAAVDGVFVPFRFGTGQKIKVVEALSFGVPVICTRSAADGVPARHSAHLHESFDTLLEEMERFAQDTRFRKILAAESMRLFADYTAQTEEALEVIARFASSKSYVFGVDYHAMWRSFRAGSRADAIDEIVPLITILDILNGLLPNSQVEPIQRALRETFRAAVEGREPEASRDEARPTAQTLTLGGIVGAGPGVRIWTKGEPDRAEEGVVDVVIESGRAGVGGSGPAALRFLCPVPAWHERRSEMKGVALLVDSGNDPTVAALAGRLESRLRRFRQGGVSIVVIGDDGVVGRWAKGALHILETGEDAYRTIVTSRGLLMVETHVAISVGRTFSRMGNLRRLVLNECGPLISLAPPGDHVVFLPGEAVARDLRAAAVWAGLFLQCYETAWRFTECRRSAVSSLSWSDTVGQQIEQLLFGPRNDVARVRSADRQPGVAA